MTHHEHGEIQDPSTGRVDGSTVNALNEVAAVWREHRIKHNGNKPVESGSIDFGHHESLYGKDHSSSQKYAGADLARHPGDSGKSGKTQQEIHHGSSSQSLVKQAVSESKSAVHSNQYGKFFLSVHELQGIDHGKPSQLNKDFDELN